MSAEATRYTIFASSLVSGLVVALVGFWLGSRWFARFPRLARVGAITLVGVVSLVAYGVVLQVIVNIAENAGPWGVWVDPSALSRIIPLAAGVVGSALGSRRGMRRIRVHSGGTMSVSVWMPVTAARRVAFAVGVLIAAVSRVAAQTTTPETTPPPAATITPTMTPLSLTGPSSGGCQVKPPVLISRVEPEYTADAKKGGLEGQVVLQAVIATDGSVQDLRVLKSATYSLDQFAMQAVRQWRYKPALCGETPVRVYLTVTVTFSLGKKK